MSCRQASEDPAQQRAPALACTPLPSLHTPSCAHWFPNAVQVSAQSDPAQGLGDPLEPEHHSGNRIGGRSTPATCKENSEKPSSSANRILAFVRKIKTGLRFSFAASASPALALWLICSFQSAGRKRWQLGRLSSMRRSPTGSKAAARPHSWIPSWGWASRYTPREYCLYPRPHEPLYGPCPNLQAAWNATSCCGAAPCSARYCLKIGPLFYFLYMA